jgi:hypothetical protein
MKSMLEISKAKDEKLLVSAKEKLARYNLLKEIYDDVFLQQLIDNKNDRDNILLFWLVTDSEIDRPIAARVLDEIEGMLNLFKDFSNFNSLTRKLRQWHNIPFESTITELEFAAEYLNRGYEIELEPSLPNGQNADFCAIRGSEKIFFEVKVAYKEESALNDAIVNELTERCDKVDQPFLITLNIEEDFPRSQVVPVAKFIAKKLYELKMVPCNLPQSFEYPNSEHPVLSVDVSKRLPAGEKGFVGGSTFGGGTTIKWKDLRNKIQQGIKQLNPDFPGVIILSRHHLDYSDYDVRNALYGDLSVNFLSKPARAFRTGDRIFGKQKNTRLSAVIYYEKILQNTGYLRRKTVYHNPFGKCKLQKEVFEGENVTQY